MGSEWITQFFSILFKDFAWSWLRLILLFQFFKAEQALELEFSSPLQAVSGWELSVCHALCLP